MDEHEQTTNASPSPLEPDAATPAAEAAAAAGPAENAKRATAALAADLVAQAEGLLGQARRLLEGYAGGGRPTFSQPHEAGSGEGDGARVIEGVFDGQRMIGPDGRPHSVPANYASKSKLVEGDLLKLTITARGAFIYKQIGPTARRRLKGVLVRQPSSAHEWAVKVGDRTYRVLTASVTYFRGHEGDEAVILVPESAESRWGAVENILKSGELAAADGPEPTSPLASALRDDLDTH